MEKDFSSGTESMDALAQGYYGVTSYNSTQNKNIKEFVDTCFPQMYYLDINHYNFTGNVQNNEMAAFLGIRYVLSKDGTLDSDRYTKIGQFGEVYVYENVLPSDMGRFYENIISEDSLKKLVNEENCREHIRQAEALEGGQKIESLDQLNGKKEGQEESEVTLYAPVKDS